VRKLRAENPELRRANETSHAAWGQAAAAAVVGDLVGKAVVSS
jgi:hypothetical protein